jgi:hypothetical protein
VCIVLIIKHQNKRKEKAHTHNNEKQKECLLNLFRLKIMSSDEEERTFKKQIFKKPMEVQKARVDRLMNNVAKPVFIPEKKEMKEPRAFKPHEFVRNVMGKKRIVI